MSNPISYNFNVVNNIKQIDKPNYVYLGTKNKNIYIEIDPNSLIAEYKIDDNFEKPIGSGGNYCFFAGKTQDGKPCAIGVYEHQDLVEALSRAISAAQFKDLHIPRVIGTTAIKDRYGKYYPAIVYERIFGKNGMKYLETRPSIDSMIQVLSQVAEAIDYMHQEGCIHNDIKWSNIMIGNTDPNSQNQNNAYLLDIEKILRIGTSTTYEEGIFVTSTYMTPEQAEAIDKETSVTNESYIDYWKLGVMYLFAISNGNIQIPFLNINNQFVNSTRVVSAEMAETQRTGKIPFKYEYLRDDLKPEYTNIVDRLSIFFGENDNPHNYRNMKSAKEVIGYLSLQD